MEIQIFLKSKQEYDVVSLPCDAMKSDGASLKQEPTSFVSSHSTEGIVPVIPRPPRLRLVSLFANDISAEAEKCETIALA